MPKEQYLVICRSLDGAVESQLFGKPRLENFYTNCNILQVA